MIDYSEPLDEFLEWSLYKREDGSYVFIFNDEYSIEIDDAIAQAKFIIDMAKKYHW
jgi:hypothetical protein